MKQDKKQQQDQKRGTDTDRNDPKKQQIADPAKSLGTEEAEKKDTRGGSRRNDQDTIGNP